MPTRSPTRSKSAVVKRPVKKRVVAKKTPAKRATVKLKLPKLKIIGRATHYYDKIGVAIIELAAPIKVGDTVTFKHAEHENSQTIHSMQINHVPVEKAKKGEIVGVKVDLKVHDGSLVVPAES